MLAEPGGVRQPLYLGIHRSDYMLHEEPASASASHSDGSSGSDSGGKIAVSLRQIELNTVSSAFAGLSARISQLHAYMLDRFSAWRPDASTGGGMLHLQPLTPALKPFVDASAIPAQPLPDATSVASELPVPGQHAARLPTNHCDVGVADGIAAAHKAYGVSRCAPDSCVRVCAAPDSKLPINTAGDAVGAVPLRILHATELYAVDPHISHRLASRTRFLFPRPMRHCSAVVLFVVQPGERNILDQRVLEHALWARHRVPVRRVTLEWLGTHGRLGCGRYVPKGASAASEHCLLIPREFSAAGDGSGDASAAAAAGTASVSLDEVSVVYYRSGYSPGDFTSEACWAAKLTAERSVAVKCPPILYHLAGTKKVQQALALPGAVERFVPAPVAAHLRRCFAGLWSLDPAERDAEAVSDGGLLHGKPLYSHSA